MHQAPVGAHIVRPFYDAHRITDRALVGRDDLGAPSLLPGTVRQDTHRGTHSAAVGGSAVYGCGLPLAGSVHPLPPTSRCCLLRRMARKNVTPAAKVLRGKNGRGKPRPFCVI